MCINRQSATPIPPAIIEKSPPPHNKNQLENYINRRKLWKFPPFSDPLQLLSDVSCCCSRRKRKAVVCKGNRRKYVRSCIRLLRIASHHSTRILIVLVWHLSVLHKYTEREKRRNICHGRSRKLFAICVVLSWGQRSAQIRSDGSAKKLG